MTTISDDGLVDLGLALDPAVRWVAVGGNNKKKPIWRYRDGVTPVNDDVSDEAEERIVNPALLTLATARADWGVGGLDFLIVAYGAINQVVSRLDDGRHISLSIDKHANAYAIGNRLKARLSNV